MVAVGGWGWEYGLNSGIADEGIEFVILRLRAHRLLYSIQLSLLSIHIHRRHRYSAMYLLLHWARFLATGRRDLILPGRRRNVGLKVGWRVRCR